MDIYSEKILKYLNKFSSKSKPISYDKIIAYTQYEEEIVNDSLKILEDKNYIITLVESFDYAGVFQLVPYYYYSTIKGREYFKNKRIKQFKNTMWELIRSIFHPVIVVFITTSITLWLLSL